MPRLRMVEMRFDLRSLYELGRRHRLPLREADVGYLLHCQLKELFGEQAPSPFSIVTGRGRSVGLRAYTSRSKDDLLRQARAFADPAIHATCNLGAMKEIALPAAWPQGARFAFEVRACPVVRMSTEGPRWRRGAEVDAFLARSWRSGGEGVDREQVYRDWLRAELERRGGASLARFELKAFQRERLLRRAGGPEPSSRLTERPDARLAGEIEITDGDAFQALLARGIGRHRAFGFGMLLIQPARPS